MISTLYPSLDSVRAVLGRIETYEDFCARHPIRKEKNSAGVEVFYIKFGSYWFAAGILPEAAEWKRRQGWRWAFNRTAGVVWC